MRPIRGALAAVAAVVTTGGLVAACGSSTHGGGVTVEPGPAALARAYTAVQSARSSRVSFEFQITTAAGSENGSGGGDFRWSPVEGALTMKIDVASQNVTVPMRMIGDTIYEELPSAIPQLGGKRWVGLSLAGFVNYPSAGFDPSQELSLLAAQASSVTKVGTVKVLGVPTTEYVAVLDVAKPSPYIGPEGRQLIQNLAASGLTSVPVSVWIDSAGRPRQMKITETLARPPAGAPASSAAAYPITVTYTMNFTDFGIPVTVTAPPASQVDSLSLQRLLQMEGS